MTVGRMSGQSYLRVGIDDYLKRLRRYGDIEMIELPDVRGARSMTETEQCRREGETILSRLMPGDRLVLLDERGREYTSREFASFLGSECQTARRLVLVVGGPYGFDDAVYARCDAKVSLSRMTFNHEMVRLFLAEQVYRAMTILRGEPYHHD